MWWKKRSDEVSTGRLTDLRELSALRDAVATLTRRADDAESALRRLQVEWTDTLDRVTRMAGRVAKRAERAERAADDADDAQVPLNGVSEAMVQVAKRRSRGWPGGGR